MKCRQKFAAFVAAVFGLVVTAGAVDWASMESGTALNVPENTVLKLTTADEITRLATYTAIDIPATSEIVADQDSHSTTLALSANLTGAGKISFCRFKDVTLSGDNTAFAGEFFSSNTTVNVSSPSALGVQNKVTHYLGNLWYSSGANHSAFRMAGGTYANEFHFHQNASARDGSRAVAIPTSGDSVEFTGSVHFYGDVGTYVSGSGKFIFKGSVYQHDPTYSTTFGGFSQVRLANNSAQNQVWDCGDGYIKIVGSCDAIGGEYRCGRFVVSGSSAFTFYYGANVIFSPNASLQFTSDFTNESQQQADSTLYKGSITWDGSETAVHSFSNLLYRDGIDASNVKSTDNTLKMNGILRVTGCGPDFGWNVKCMDNAKPMSIQLDSQTEPAGSLKLINANSTMTGTLEAKRGTLIIGEGARFSGVTTLVASGDGVIEVRDAEAFPSGPVTLKFAGPDSGAISIPAGLTFAVDKVLVNGVEMMVGDYFGAAGKGAFQVLGGGTLRVQNGKTESKSVNWNGSAGDGNFFNPANWSYGYPEFDGTEKLVLYNGYISANDTGVINIDREVRFSGLSVNVQKSFTFNATGTGRIIFCPNGTGDSEMGKGSDWDQPDGVSGYANIVLLNYASEPTATNTYTFNIPITFAPGYDRNITCGSWARARFMGDISGGDPDHRIGIYWYKYGQTTIEFGGNNEGWLSPLRFRSIYDLVVSGPNGLGGPDRVTEVKTWGDYHVRYVGNGLTNNTPTRLWIADGYGDTAVNSNTFLTATFEDPLVMKAPLHLIGATSHKMLVGDYDFQGGIVAERNGSSGDDRIQLHQMNGHPLRIGGPFVFPESSFETRANTTSELYLGGTGSVLRTLWLMNVWANCEREGVLSKDTACRIGTSAWNKGGFRLHGSDQDLQSIVIDDYIEITESTSVATYGATVESESPATLTLWPTSALPAAIVRFRDQASLTLNGAADSSMTLVNGFSDTAGDLTVNSGTLVFKWGAGWGGTNVFLNAGTLRVSEKAGSTAFGDSTRRADVTIASGAQLEVDAGITAYVGALTVNGQALMRGRWGGLDCRAVAPDHRIAGLAGQGVVRVTKGVAPGALILVR